MIPFLVAGIQELAEKPLRELPLYKVPPIEVTKATDTKNIILDAAENVFAQYGYYASTMRKIMKTASTNLSLAYYHFENKHDIFIAVHARRAKQSEALRLQMFEELQDKDPFDEDYLEHVIRAYIEVPFAYTIDSGENWRNYIQLLAITAHTPLWNVAASCYNTVVNNLTEALGRRSATTDDSYMWCCLYVMGALFCSLAQSKRFENLSDGKCKSSLAEESYKRIRPFLTAGCKRILSGDLA
jgi:AcrR family transcriptional regulator